MEKVQWNSINKKQNKFKYSKNDESSPSPGILLIVSDNTAETLGNGTSLVKLMGYITSVSESVP